MQHYTHTALFTTVSGVVGGVGKAISAKPLLLAITLPGLTTVIIYASASAVAGYVVKKVLDAASRKHNQFFNEKSAAENKEIIIKPLGVTQIDTIELQINWMTLTGLISNIVSKVPAVITAFKSGNKKNLIDQLGISIEMSFSTYVNGLFYESEPSKII